MAWLTEFSDVALRCYMLSHLTIFLDVLLIKLGDIFNL